MLHGSETWPVRKKNEVKQSVKLFVIQYSLTFSLSVCTLYEAPLHSLSRLSIRQLNLMSKC